LLVRRHLDLNLTLMNYIQMSILFTLEYFSLFDYPLTCQEIFNWLFDISQIDKALVQKDRLIDVGITDINDQLVELVRQKKIEYKDGYYFLPCRCNIIETREKKKAVSLRKIKKARIIAKLLRFIPGLKMIAICSNLGYFNADENADIDFFIVTKDDRIWTVRFWSTFFMKILRQRPINGKTRNKICLSYFVAQNSLNLERTRVANPDTHLIYLLSQYLPIYTEDGAWGKYIECNKWINKYLPNFRYLASAKKYIIKPRFLWLKRVIGATITSCEENFYRKIQMAIMPDVLQSAARKDDRNVIISDSILKLHINDKRSKYNKKIIGRFKI